jgi:TnpA family transposase
MLKFVAEQIGVDGGTFELYARREETRRDHTARLMVYLGTRMRQGKTVEPLWGRFRAWGII